MTVNELIAKLQKLGPENGDKKISLDLNLSESYHQEISACELVVLKQDEFTIGDDQPMHIKGMKIVELK